MTTVAAFVPSPGHVWPGHPEAPSRLTQVDQAAPGVDWLDPAPATPEEVARAYDRELVQSIELVCKRESGYIDYAPTFVTPSSYADALNAAGATTPATLNAGGDPSEAQLLTLGVLKGRNYRLAGIASFDEKDRTVTLTLNSLPARQGDAEASPAGNYEVVDVTGERPIVKPDAMAGWALAGDPDYRPVRVLAKSISAKDLASKGIENLEVKAGMGRILLIRPAGETVHVSCPEYEVRTIALRAVGTDVVLPQKGSPAVRQAVQRIVDAVNAAGGKARLVNDADVKTQPVAFDAFVHPEPAKYEHKIAEFRNAPIDTQRNLIVVGSDVINIVANHLVTPGTFTYDKVFEKISGEYPGPGRGIVGVVESVNDPSFDPTDQTRDALIVGGSDDAGTVKAIDEVIRILKAR